MSELRLIFTTIPDEAADAIVKALVETGLVACANVLAGARSTYVWQGELCRETEAVVLMETSTARLAAAQARLGELHPYECPKILVFTPTDANHDYLAWALAQTSSSKLAPP